MENTISYWEVHAQQGNPTDKEATKVGALVACFKNLARDGSEEASVLSPEHQVTAIEYSLHLHHAGGSRSTHSTPIPTSILDPNILRCPPSQQLLTRWLCALTDEICQSSPFPVSRYACVA